MPATGFITEIVDEYTVDDLRVCGVYSGEP